MGGWVWVSAAFLAAVKLLAVRAVRALGGEREARQVRWASFAGGVSVAYAVVDLLPSLARAQAKLAVRAPGPALFAEHHVYVVALGGVIVFYGLEVLARRSRSLRLSAGGGDETDPAVFWIHLAVFAIYNGVIGALLVYEKATSAQSLLWFTVAMAFHFFVNATSLQEHHQAAYRRIGRWLMAAAVFVGCGLAIVAGAASPAYVALAAFVAGGILINVFKEELPARRSIRFGAFTLGAAGFTAVLLVAAAAE